MASRNPVVKTTIELDRDEVEKFRKRNPIRGSFRWFMNEALRKINQVQEKTESKTLPEDLEQAMKEIGK